MLSRWMCDLHVVAMATSWSGGYGGALHCNEMYLSMHQHHLTELDCGPDQNNKDVSVDKLV